MKRKTTTPCMLSWILVALAGFFSGMALTGTAYATDNIVISELCINPSYLGDALDDGKEFIELYNPTDSGLDISGWYIEFKGRPSYADVIIPSGSTIEPYGYFLIADTGGNGWPGNWSSPDYHANFQLTNSKHGIRLLDVSDALVDAVGWGDLSLYPDYFEGTSLPDAFYNGHSYERKPGYSLPECGNWQDTNNNSNDFLDSDSPYPQNSSFFEEPCTESDVPPGQVASLRSTNISSDAIVWEWNNPSDPYFYQAVLFLDGINFLNTSLEKVTVGGLASNTWYTLTVKTKSSFGAVNTANATNRTKTLPSPSAECVDDSDCDDGVYCNGAERCVSETCLAGNQVSCSAFSLPTVGTCSYTPDSNPLTWDYAEAFTSVCDENSASCTTSSYQFQHNCSIGLCGAECESDSDCSATSCDYLDGCVGRDYYDYADSANFCNGNCTCTQNQCGQPAISINDSRCPQCQSDSDCDDGVYCNGQEVCDATSGPAKCFAANPTDCSQFSLPEIDACNHSPDSNPFTVDYAVSFTSVCDEQSKACTTSSYSFTHECVPGRCGAECASDSDCQDICASMDGCYEGIFRDYEAVSTSCSGCLCEKQNCSAFTEYSTDMDNDSFNTECMADCDDSNSSVNPAAEETCDGVDNNCNGLIDEGFADFDDDGIADCVDEDDDNDLLPDAVETDDSDNYTTDPFNQDSDNDGLMDGEEDSNKNGMVDGQETDPNNPDCDGDGFPDSRDAFPWDPSEHVDMDSDGLGDNSDSDIDGDSYPNSEDFITGNTYNINSTANLSYRVNGTESPGKFTGIGDVEITRGNFTVVRFIFNFSNASRLDFRDVRLEVNENNGTGSVLIAGLTAPSGKDIFLDNLNGVTSVCIKDSEVLSISSVTELCNGEDETPLMCPGASGQYSCEFADTLNTTILVRNLSHSAVRQQGFCGDGTCSSSEDCSACQADCGQCASSGGSSSSSGSTRRSSGGGAISPSQSNTTSDPGDSADEKADSQQPDAQQEADSSEAQGKQALLSSGGSGRESGVSEEAAGIPEVTGAAVGPGAKKPSSLALFIAALVILAASAAGAALFFMKSGNRQQQRPPAKARPKGKKAAARKRKRK